DDDNLIGVIDPRKATIQQFAAIAGGNHQRDSFRAIHGGGRENAPTSPAGEPSTEQSEPIVDGTPEFPGMCDPPQLRVDPAAGAELPAHEILCAPANVAENRRDAARTQHEVLACLVEAHQVVGRYGNSGPAERPVGDAWLQDHSA